mgnify:CR=1 FL=1
MGNRRLELDDGAAPIDVVGYAPQNARVAKLLNQAKSSAHRDVDRHAKRGDRQLLAPAIMDEEVDQHFPGRIAEQLGRADQLLPQQSAMIEAFGVGERYALATL